MPRASYVIVLLLILFASCTRRHGHLNLIGQWKNLQDGEMMIFEADGRLNILDAEGRSVYDSGSISMVSWEAVIEVEPHHLYATVRAGSKSARIPIGIYKVTDNRLVVREPIEYHRMIGVVDVGVARYEMPADFSGIVRVYERIRPRNLDAVTRPR